MLGCRSSDQVINAYLMNLDDFFNQNWTTPRIFLSYSWCGPQRPISKMKRHPTLNILATLDESGEFSVFDTTSATLGLRSTKGISISGILPREMASSSFVWIPSSKHPLILVSTPPRIYIYTEKLSLLGAFSNSDSISDIFALPSDDSVASFFVLGISKVKMIVSIWRLTVLEAGTIHQSYLCSSSLSSASLHFMSSFSFSFADSAKLSDHPTVLTAIDYSSKEISLWNFANPDELFSGSGQQGDGPVLSTNCTFAISALGDINLARTASFGKIAISHTLNKKQMVDIWDNEFSGLEMSREWQITLEGHVVDMDWFTSFDGQHLFAVATVGAVMIFCKSREDFGCAWIKVSENTDWSQSSIVSLAWLSNGSILVSTSTHSKIMKPWIAGGSSLVSQYLFEISSSNCGRLKDYDPSLLKNYMYWDKYDLVKYNLSMLYRFVKLSLDSGSKLLHVPIALWKVIGEDIKSPPKMAFEDLFEQQSEATLYDNHSNSLGTS